ncbi:hypothetical protein HDU93_001628 [Gonapodya sp. JEL0774]|nr:hypothetical protein HDU93_001628 [Gonapodya sp. JEL0774]
MATQPSPTPNPIENSSPASVPTPSKPPVDLQSLFRWGKVLGKGSFAEVVLVKEVEGTSKESYAMKIISKKAIKSPKDKDYLIREIQIMKEVDHPNCLKLYNVFESDTRVFLQLEYAQGGELLNLVTSSSRYGISEAMCRSIVKSVASALMYLHAKGIVHRDLKLENVLLKHKVDYLDDESEDEDWRVHEAMAERIGKEVKVGDFGLSNWIQGKKMLQTQVGSFAYMAPEVLTNKGYDTKCDLWSLGCVTYLLLSGFFPFGADDQVTMFRHIQEGKYVFPSDIWSYVSLESRDFIHKLLVVDPRRRLSAEQALRHPWLTSERTPRPTLQRPRSLSGGGGVRSPSRQDDDEEWEKVETPPAPPPPSQPAPPPPLPPRNTLQTAPPVSSRNFLQPPSPSSQFPQSTIPPKSASPPQQISPLQTLQTQPQTTGRPLPHVPIVTHIHIPSETPEEKVKAPPAIMERNLQTVVPGRSASPSSLASPHPQITLEKQREHNKKVGKNIYKTVAAQRKYKHGLREWWDILNDKFTNHTGNSPEGAAQMVEHPKWREILADDEVAKQHPHLPPLESLRRTVESGFNDFWTRSIVGTQPVRDISVVQRGGTSPQNEGTAGNKILGAVPPMARSPTSPWLTSKKDADPEQPPPLIISDATPLLSSPSPFPTHPQQQMRRASTEQIHVKFVSEDSLKVPDGTSAGCDTEAEGRGRNRRRRGSKGSISSLGDVLMGFGVPGFFNRKPRSVSHGSGSRDSKDTSQDSLSEDGGSTWN